MTPSRRIARVVRLSHVLLKKFMSVSLASVAAVAMAEPTGCPEFTVERPRPTGGAVVLAVDFGLDAKGDKNAAAINRALAEAMRVKASRVELAPGTYRCYDEPGVVIRDFTDFTFDGKGAVLVFRRPAEYRCQPQSELILDKGNVLVQRCVRTEVCNLTMDWDWKNDPLAGFVKCVAKHPSKDRADAWFELEFVDWARHPFYPNPCPLQKLQAMRDDHKGFRKGFACSFGQSEGHFGAKNEWVKPNVLRVWPGVLMPGRNQNPQHAWGQPSVAEKVTVGETYRVQHCYYGKNGFNFDSNRHFTFRDITVWSCFGMAFVTDGTQKHWQFENVKVVPPTKAEFAAAYPGERFFERPVTSVSDGHHVARSCGWCKYLNCTWSRNNDDSSNFHDRFTIAIRVADKALQVINRRGEEYFRAAVGTTFELRNPDFSPTGAFVKLVRKQGDMLYVDRPLPEQKGQCFLVWDRTYGTDNVLVKGCKFVDSAFRNIFSPSNLTIEDCDFVRTGGYPIQFIADYRSDLWCEGLGATNLVVRNCRFEDTNVIHPDGPQISTVCVTPTGWQIPPPDKGFVGGDLLIEGCTFVRPTGPVLKLTTGKNVIFRNCTIDLRETVGATESAGKLLTDGAENVKVENVRLRK